MDTRTVSGGLKVDSARRLRNSCLQWAASASLGALTLLTAPSAPAQEISVVGGNCASGVHVVARDAHLADVLKRLAQMLDFKLSFESENNPVVTVDATGTASELVARLASSGNVSMTQARNPGCPQRERIVNVWVLPNSPERLTRVVATSPPAQEVRDEQKRKEQEGFELILKSHGIAIAQGGQTESRPQSNGESGQR